MRMSLFSNGKNYWYHLWEYFKEHSVTQTDQLPSYRPTKQCFLTKNVKIQLNLVNPAEDSRVDHIDVVTFHKICYEQRYHLQLITYIYSNFVCVLFQFKVQTLLLKHPLKQNSEIHFIVACVNFMTIFGVFMTIFSPPAHQNFFKDCVS